MRLTKVMHMNGIKSNDGPQFALDETDVDCDGTVYHIYYLACIGFYDKGCYTADSPSVIYVADKEGKVCFDACGNPKDPDMIDIGKIDFDSVAEFEKTELGSELTARLYDIVLKEVGHNWFEYAGIDGGNDEIPVTEK